MGSPTYVIAKEYETKKGLLVHIDAYRIDTLADAVSCGLEDYLNNPKAIVLIEWPEKVVALLPKHTLLYQISLTDNERRIEAV